MKATDEHREDAKDIAAALADLKRIVNAPALARGTAEPILGPGWTISPPPWATFRLDSFEADDGTVNEGAARQWLRENELAAWPESFVQAPCRVRMTKGRACACGPIYDDAPDDYTCPDCEPEEPVARWHLDEAGRMVSSFNGLRFFREEEAKRGRAE